MWRLSPRRPNMEGGYERSKMEKYETAYDYRAKVSAEDLATALERDHKADAAKHSLHAWFNYALHLAIDEAVVPAPDAERPWKDLYEKTIASSLLVTNLPESVGVVLDENGDVQGEYALPFDASELDCDGDSIGKALHDCDYETSGGYRALMDFPWAYVTNPKTEETMMHLATVYGHLREDEGKIAEEVISATRRRGECQVPQIPIALPLPKEELVKRTDAYYEHHAKQRFWEAEAQVRANLEGIPFGLINPCLRWHVLSWCIQDGLASQNWDDEEEGKMLASAWFWETLEPLLFPQAQQSGYAFTDSEKRKMIPQIAAIMAKNSSAGYSAAAIEEDLREKYGMKSCMLFA